MKKKKGLHSGSKGKFIAIYGINGIGKTTQVDLLVAHLQEKGIKASRLKYPVYNLDPEGPFLNRYLRNPDFKKEHLLSTHQLQEKFRDNRARYEPTLKKRLSSGEWIIAEDYTGTGIAWGLTWGGELEYLEEINKNLLKPDLEILMNGNRFLTAIEENHSNEENEEKITICKNFLFLLAKRFGWSIINTDKDKKPRSIKSVRMEMKKIIEENFEI